MNKLFTLMLTVFLCSSVFAGNAKLFSYDADYLNDEFEELNKLEDHVKANNNISLLDLQSSNYELLSNLNLNQSSLPPSSFSIEEMDWGAFLWGFFCGGCGVLIVYLNEDKRTNERMVSSLIGCGVSAAVSAVSYVLNPTIYTY